MRERCIMEAYVNVTYDDVNEFTESNLIHLQYINENTISKYKMNQTFWAINRW